MRFQRSFCYVAITAAALSSPDTGACQDNVSIVQAFVRAAYPDLSQGGLHAGITGSGSFDEAWVKFSHIRVDIYGPTEPLRHPSDLAPRLSVTTVLSAHGRVLTVRASGEHLSTEKRDRLIADANRRPRWDESRINRELLARGARYTQAREVDFLRNLNLAALEPFIGSVVERSASFSTGYVDRANGSTLLSVDWRVEVETKGSGGQRQRYILAFEPFEGRLVRLTHTAILDLDP